MKEDVTQLVYNNSHHAYFPFCDTNLGWLLKKLDVTLKLITINLYKSAKGQGSRLHDLG